MPIQSFQPPVRTLLGPGPAEVHPRVLAAMSRPTIGHLDPAFVQMMDELKTLLQYAFMTENGMTMAVSAPGSAGMEACFANLVEPGNKVIICDNGVFAGRMRENVERVGGTAIMVKDDWGRPIDPNKLNETLKANPDTQLVAFVHAETSTGALSDARTLIEIAHEFGALTIVDAVTSAGGSELRVDEWEIDAIYSGSQKCLSSAAGLSPLSMNNAAMERISKRRSKVPSWFLDVSLVTAYWHGGKRRSYHHTAPINNLYGLHEALVMLHQEGLENSWARHRQHHLALKAGLEAMNLRFLVEESYRLPQLNAIIVPEGIDEALVRQRLLNEYSIEIGAGLGDLSGKIWRIGLMGYSSNEKNVLFFLTALDEILGSMKAPILKGLAVEAAAAAYS
ncbi:MAG TPA: alanine--glyoxylate aminotransferase family protein [Burkholderiales bacterium]|nr:alanine--glyoxylate aminotransferase family protein [Burkholderiales bacterium]